jgi:hypothetical protein
MIHEISIQQGSMTLSGEWVGVNPLESPPSP